MSVNKREYFKQYEQAYQQRISLNLSKNKDKDILQAIEQVGKGNKQAGIKTLIRLGIQSLNS